ncbi:hypothetical protein [Paracidovorax oryzae]|uniref:hypothetical protein n=1 Tax=Paracidovorax oryzae TaxID=862720 RepID=UPI0002EB37C1|nr:hypothetical protein [Paracidovorax oryzae]
MTDIVSPPVITAMPPAPQPTDTPSDFKAKAFASVAAQAAFVPQVNALGANVFQNAAAAVESAAAAAGSAATAATQAGNATAARLAAESARDKAVIQVGMADAARLASEGARDMATAQANDASKARSAAELARDTAVEQAANAGNARLAAEAARDAAVSVAAFGFTATSSSALPIGLGTKTFAVESGKSFVRGQYVSAASVADPSIFMAGLVTAYDGMAGQLTLAVNSSAGTGTVTRWQLGLAAMGVAAGLQVIAPNTYSDADLLPLNTVTTIFAANSAFGTSHLPIIIANSVSPGWGDGWSWVLETLGFGAGEATGAVQRATPIAVGNAAGTGLRWERKRVGNSWGRWHPGRVLPTSVLSSSGGHMYGDGIRGLNRVNVISLNLSSAASAWSMPATPQDGDQVVVVTNSRADNVLAYSDAPILGNGFSLSAAGDTVVLNRAYTRFIFIFNAPLGAWGVV